MIKSVIFDLDNTLYPEETYVKSGFSEVSKYLSKKYDFDEKKLFSKIMDIFHEDGRGSIFNRLIEDLEIEEDVLTLVYVYRYHIPKINLYPNANTILKCLKKDFQIGLITDGRAFVQKRKVDALDIEKYFDLIIFTDVLGEHFWKPSVEPYNLILNHFNCKPEESIYIGDDPYKDFKAPKKLGMKSIQVNNEKELDYWKKRGYDRVNADISVNSLNEVLGVLYENCE